jgi:hypothetical protein
MQFFDNKGTNYSSEKKEVVYDNNGEVVAQNKKNAEEYERLMRNASSKKREYYDINDGIVKIILLVLATFIVLGAIFVILRGM